MNKAIPIIIGTAGHVDHGKTSLVKALTDFETDRHPEEKKRGMSIDFAVAPFNLSSGEVVGLVDVPGHRDFIRNMTAGASSVDVVLLVVSADDGVMPQTEEHVQILSHLDTKIIVPVITKIDLVDQKRILEVKEEINTLLDFYSLKRSDDFFLVSNIKKEGIDALRAFLEKLTLELSKTILDENQKIPFRMYLRTAFNIKGSGTVVTGIPTEGKIKNDQELELLSPVKNKSYKIKFIQNYRSEVLETKKGISSAINLRNSEVSEFNRGQVLVSPGIYHLTKSVNCWIKNSSKDEIIKRGRQLIFSTGTLSVSCKIYPLGGIEILPNKESGVRIVFSNEVLLVAGDRFILRDNMTIGGGRVLSVYSKPISSVFSKERLADFERGLLYLEENNSFLSELECGELLFISRNHLVLLLKIRDEFLNDETSKLDNKLILRIGKNTWINLKREEFLRNRIYYIINNYHLRNPLKIGITIFEVSKYFGLDSIDDEVFKKFILLDNRLESSKNYISCKSFKPQISKKELEAYEQVLRILEMLPGVSIVNLLEEIKLTEKEFSSVRRILESEALITVIDSYIFSSSRIETFKKVLTEFTNKDGFALADFRAKTSLSRNLAVPVLDYFDRNHITKRVGDLRVLL